MAGVPQKSGLDHDQAALHTVAADIVKFLIAPLQAVRKAEPFTLSGAEGDPWERPTSRF